ncbi:MAG: hypothetical protein ACRBN8_23970 [Nannocystales bacterium]
MTVIGRPGWALAAALLMSCKAAPTSAPTTVGSVIAAGDHSEPREQDAVLLGTVTCISVRRCVDLLAALVERPTPKISDVLLDARLEFLVAEVDGKTIPGIRLSGGAGVELREELEKLEAEMGTAWVLRNQVEISADSVVVSESGAVSKTFSAAPPQRHQERADATLVAHIDSSKLSSAQRDRLISDAHAKGDAAEASEPTMKSFRQAMRSDQWRSYLESNASLDASLRYVGKTISFDVTVTPESGSTLQLDYQQASQATSRSASLVPYASAFSGSIALPVPLDELDRTEMQDTLQEIRLLLPIAIAQAPSPHRPVLLENGSSLLDVLEHDLLRETHAGLDLAASLDVEDAATLTVAFTGFAKSGYPQLVRVTETLARAFPQPGIAVLEPPVGDYEVALFDVDLATVLPPMAPYFGEHPRAALGTSHDMLWFTLGSDPLAAMDRLHDRATGTRVDGSDATLRLHFNLAEALSADPRVNLDDIDGSLIVDLQSKNHPTHNTTTGSVTLGGRQFVQGFISGLRKSLWP